MLIIETYQGVTSDTEDFLCFFFSWPASPSSFSLPQFSFLPEFRDQTSAYRSVKQAPKSEKPSASFIFLSMHCLIQTEQAQSFPSPRTCPPIPDLECPQLSPYLLCLPLASLLPPNLIMKPIPHCLFVSSFNALFICLHIRMPV